MKKWLLLFLLIPSIVFADWSVSGVTDPQSVSGVVKPQSVSGVTCTYFDSWPSSINATYWTETDVDSLLSVVSGKLNFAYTGTASVKGSLVSKYYFNADTDFDIRIEFNYSATGDPDAGGNDLSFEVGDSSFTIDSYIDRFHNSAGNDFYEIGGSSTSAAQVATSDTSGKFRFLMVSGVLKGYVWDSVDSRWEWNGSTDGVTFSEDLSGENVYIKLYFDHGLSAGSTSIDFDFDNLRVVNGCENITLP